MAQYKDGARLEKGEREPTKKPKQLGSKLTNTPPLKNNTY